MNRFTLAVLALLSLAAAGVLVGRMQAVQAAPAQQSSQSTAPPTTQSSPPPASPQQNSSPQSNSGNPAQATEKSDKKVWTNDDVGDLRDRSAISTIGDAAPPPKKPVTKPAPALSAAKIKWYIDQISALQAKIPPLNAKISQLQAALNGDQVDAPRQYGWARPDDWRDELQRLQKQRDDLQAKISDLEDQARHDGVPANQVP